MFKINRSFLLLSVLATSAFAKEAKYLRLPTDVKNLSLVSVSVETTPGRGHIIPNPAYTGNPDVFEQRTITVFEKNTSVVVKLAYTSNKAAASRWDNLGERNVFTTEFETSLQFSKNALANAGIDVSSLDKKALRPGTRQNLELAAKVVKVEDLSTQRSVVDVERSCEPVYAEIDDPIYGTVISDTAVGCIETNDYKMFKVSLQ